jgi:hypothetical protein
VIGWLRDTWAELIYLQRRLLELQMQASLRIAPEPSEREEGPYDRLGLAPDNQRIELLGMDRNEFRDGKMARHQIFYDGAAVAHQMGAAPESVPLGGDWRARIPLSPLRLDAS